MPERSDRECDDKEETRRVSDAVNDKLESGEALPERSDRECDEMEVPGAEAPDVTYCRVRKASTERNATGCNPAFSALQCNEERNGGNTRAVDGKPEGSH